VEYGGPKFVLYDESGDRNDSTAAKIIARSAGDFSEATLLFECCLSGDGRDEHLPHDARWRAYRQWRASHGETGQLYNSPGHRFDAGEAERLSEAIAFALTLGWDAMVAAKPGRQLLFLSHDDRLEIYRDFGGGALVRGLIALGDWRRAVR
jgi:hypothetical protein